MLIDQKRVIRRYYRPFTIQLKNRANDDPVQNDTEVRTTPGRRTTGIAVVLKTDSEDRTVYQEEIQHRTDISHRLQERRNHRRRRRGEKWYRARRFNNRQRPADRLPPSIENVGRALDTDQNGIQELEEEVLQNPRRVEISQVRQRAYGIVMPVSDADQRAYELPLGTTGVLWWNDGDPDDEITGLNAITADELKELIGSSMQAAIDYVVAHYQATPGNNSHPAYRLYQLNTAVPQTFK